MVKKSVLVRIPAGVHQQLVDRAKRIGRSVNEEICKGLEIWVEMGDLLERRVKASDDRFVAIEQRVLKIEQRMDMWGETGRVPTNNKDGSKTTAAEPRVVPTWEA